jgi:hypothetical protein
MSISTYFRPNIHQNGPEILGVNGLLLLTKNLGSLGDSLLLGRPPCEAALRDTIAECSWCQPVYCSAANWASTSLEWILKRMLQILSSSCFLGGANEVTQLFICVLGWWTLIAFKKARGWLIIWCIFHTLFKVVKAISMCFDFSYSKSNSLLVWLVWLQE